MSEDTPVGPHFIRDEGDIFVWILHGTVEVEHVQVTYQRSVDLARQYGYCLNLFDSRHGGSVSAEARRVSGELSRRSPLISATAIFGANLLMRTLTTLLWRAVAMLTHQKTDLEFFATEPEARAWLALQRPKLAVLAASERRSRAL